MRMASDCKRSWKAIEVELAGALVHHPRDEISEAVLALGVLRGAAAEGKAHGDQRVGVALDEPGLDAAGARDVLDVHGAGRRRGERSDEASRRGQPKPVPPARRGKTNRCIAVTTCRGLVHGPAARHCGSACSGVGSSTPVTEFLSMRYFPRDVADALDGHLLQPLGPRLDIRDGHAGGEPPTIVARHARLAVGGVDELGEIGAARAVELFVRDAVVAQSRR